MWIGMSHLVNLICCTGCFINRSKPPLSLSAASYQYTTSSIQYSTKWRTVLKYIHLSSVFSAIISCLGTYVGTTASVHFPDNYPGNGYAM